MNELKKLLKSTLVYFIGNVATKLVAFLLIPIYTKFLSPAEYGFYDLSVAYVELIVSVLFLDVWSGIMRFMFDYKNKEDKLKVIPNGLIIYGSSALLYTIILPIVNMYLELNYISYIYLYGLSLTFQSLYSYISRALGYNKQFALSGVLSTFINATCNILLIVVFKFDYKSLFIAYSLGILVQCLYLEMNVHMFKAIHIKYFDKHLVKSIFLFSAPLCVNSFCYWLLTGFNKVVISNQLTVADNGYYALASKFAIAITLVSSCFTMAWQELAYGKANKDISESHFYSVASQKYINLLFIAFLGMLPCICIIFPYFVDPNYILAKGIIPIYIIAIIFSVFSSFLSNIISAYKQNKYIFISTLLACITNVLCALYLIPNLGLIGACISLACGYAVNCLIRILILKKIISLKFKYSHLLYMIPICIIYIYIYDNLSFIYQILAILMAILIGIVIFRNDIKNIVHLIFKKIS